MLGISEEWRRRSSKEKVVYSVVIHGERVFRYIVMNQNAIYVYHGKPLTLSMSTFVVSLPWFSLGF